MIKIIISVILSRVNRYVGRKREIPEKKTPDHPQAEHTFYESDDIFNVDETNSLLSSTSFATVNSGLSFIHFVVLFQVFKCLVPDILDKYKCVFTNSREYVQEAVLECLPFTCIVLASITCTAESSKRIASGSVWETIRGSVSLSSVGGIPLSECNCTS